MRKLLLQFQWHIVVGAFVLIALAICMRLWSLRLLIDSDIRSSAEYTMRRVSEENGWLLSSLFVRFLTREEIEICHREFWRGEDPVQCEVYPFPSE